jgi:hypothetical protein
LAHIAAWEIGSDEVPRRIPSDREFLEKHLEGWIERDPSLLASDVQWASRQLTLPDGSRLDLLGLSKDKTWVVVELKGGPPGAGAVDQVLHYFMQIATMTDGELAHRIRAQGISDEAAAPALEELAPDADDSARDYLLLVAGVGTGEAAQASAATLTRHGFDVPIRVVSFQVLRDSDGRRILVREVEDAPYGEAGSEGSRYSLDDVLDYAARCGVRAGFEAIRRHLLDRGFRQSRKRYGLNFNTGSRLQCLWVTPVEGAIHMGYLSGNFPTLYGIDEGQAEAELGDNWIDLEPDEALNRITRWADAIDRYRRVDTAEEGAGDC